MGINPDAPKDAGGPLFRRAAIDGNAKLWYNTLRQDAKGGRTP